VIEILREYYAEENYNPGSIVLVDEIMTLAGT
jgi:hypothetical protein